MRKRFHSLRRRALSALLAAVMLTTLAPMAMAAEVDKDSKCTSNPLETDPVTYGAHDWKITTNITPATCHTKGSVQYKCTHCGNTYTETTDLNPDNHELVYTDKRDGKTHSVYCPYDPKISFKDENHTFEKGRCTKCSAVDYSSVDPSIEKNKTVYVAIGEENAKLSMEDITLTAGSADITDEYTITYAWFYQGKWVGEGSTYTLDSSFTGKEADYTFTCVILAAPKNGVAAESVNATCTVSVLVRDLIVARATMNVKDEELDFDDTTDSMSSSIYDQIYDAVYDVSSGEPSYVVFDNQPDSKVGYIDAKGLSSHQYQFGSKSGDSYLRNLTFVLDEEPRTGTYTINFRAWDSKNKEFPGVLTIYVEKSLADSGVLYSGVKGEDVALKAEDFERFWLETYDSGELEYVVFKTPSDGNLYYDGKRVSTGKDGDEFYFEPTKNRQMDLDEVVFTPRKSFTGTVTIDFTATGTSRRSREADLDGTVTILLTDGEVEDISYRVPTGGSAALDGEDFLEIFRSATGTKTGSTFYIQFLTLPSSGSFYVDRTNSRPGTELRSSNQKSYQFHYDSNQNREIEDLTYVPGTAAKDSAVYAAYDSKGEPVYVGTILFERDDLTVEYTVSSAAGVSFKANDFRTLLGTGASEAVTAVSFSAPSAGTLYYNYVGGVGTQVTSSDKYYTSGSTMSVSSLTYVPQAGQAAGEVTIPFTAYDLSNNKVSGEVKITVPEIATKPGTTPGTDRPSTPITVSFSDVPNTKDTEWYYTPVMELASAGIINGYEDGTFKPANEVTYGQALKLIMMAAGYEDLSRTGNGWAQGFLEKALEDGLLTQTVNLDKKITRKVIADIAYKALKLNKPTISSPFYDSADESALALYEAGIVKGEERSGNLMFFGNYSITRREMAVIIWRMNSYAQAQG